jgi:hypothetical protein
MPVETERRKERRGRDSRASRLGEITLSFPDNGRPDMPASLADLSEWGLGVETALPLQVGSRIVATGAFFSANSALGSKRDVRVVHCRSHDRVYRCGLAFEDDPSARQDQQRQMAAPPAEELDGSFVDHYETLQISPNADFDTIQRVYRMLAQRFHPDNGETGDEGAFRVVLQAFHVLSDPETRAAYDVQFRASRTLRWKIFDQPNAARGIKGERQTRKGILALLYTKRLEQPDKPGCSVKDLESLLGCPREHLDFSLWYLRSKGLIASGDNGRYHITAEGVDVFQEAELQQSESGGMRLLEAASEPSHAKAGNGSK